MDTDDTMYRLSPKGLLWLEAGSDELWNKLLDFVADAAKRDGHPDGFPTLIFDEGGVCVTANNGE